MVKIFDRDYIAPEPDQNLAADQAFVAEMKRQAEVEVETGHPQLAWMMRSLTLRRITAMLWDGKCNAGPDYSLDNLVEELEEARAFDQERRREE